MKVTYKELQDLVIATNENLQRVGIQNSYKLRISNGHYSIVNEQTRIVCAGTLKECEIFLRGINSLIQDNMSYFNIANDRNVRFGFASGTVKESLDSPTIETDEEDWARANK